MDQKVIDDVSEAADSVEKVKTLLNALYYNVDFGTFSTRPVISMLITACDYLASNLKILAEKYRSKSV